VLKSFLPCGFHFCCYVLSCAATLLQDKAKPRPFHVVDQTRGSSWAPELRRCLQSFPQRLLQRLHWHR